LQNVLEQITVNQTPREDAHLPISMDLATLWVRDDLDSSEDAHSRISLTGPSGKTLGQWEMGVDLTEYTRARSKIRFNGMPASEGGVYLFRVEQRPTKRHKWREVAQVPLQILFQQQDISNEE
jgi:hypothetical protein